MAERAGAKITEVNGSHVIMVSQPEAVTNVILEAVAAVTDDAVKPIEEVVVDKGYHSRTTVHDLETLEIRTYISEPDRGPQS